MHSLSLHLAVTAALGSLALAACQNGGPSKTVPKNDPAATIPRSSEEGAGVGYRLPADRVVATWSGGRLTYGELRSKNSSRFDQLHNKYMQDLYQLEQRELESHVTDTLIEAAAAKANKSPDDFLADIAGEEKVTEEEAKQFFDANLAGKGVEFEMVKQRVIDVLEARKRQEKVGEALEKLRAEANVETTLPAPEAAVAKFDLEGRPTKGPAGAKVTIVEFSDFQCPYCSRAVPGVEALLDKYGKDLRVVFLHFPLSFHEQAMPAAIASACAHRQGKFWEMHDEIFENQTNLSREAFVGYAKTLGLKVDEFTQCLDDPSVRAFVEADMQQGTAAGVQGTPSFFVNGIQHQGVPTVEAVERALKSG